MTAPWTDAQRRRSIEADLSELRSERRAVLRRLTDLRSDHHAVLVRKEHSLQDEVPRTHPPGPVRPGHLAGAAHGLHTRPRLARRHVRAVHRMAGGVRIALTLLGGSLLDLEIDTGKPKKPEVTFGFSGGSRCESIDATTGRDPLTDEDPA